MADTYNYSLIRVVPDRHRGEWVNVGVVVFLADTLDIRMLSSYSKLRVLAPTLNMGFIEKLPATWQYLCEGEESPQARQRFLANFPLAHASPLGQFVTDLRGYDEQVQSIMQDLVIPPAMPIRRQAHTRLETKLKSHFQKAKLLGSGIDDIRRHLVVSKYPVDATANLIADFALRNGKLRVTETIDFRVSREQLRQRHALAALKSMTLDRAGAKLGGDYVPSVVYAVNEDCIDLVEPSLNLLGSHSERMYDANNPQDMADYMSMMHSAAHAVN